MKSLNLVLNANFILSQGKLQGPCQKHVQSQGQNTGTDQIQEQD